MFDNDDIHKIVDDLILKGGLEVAGVDSESGEILYSFTNKLKEILPELYNDHLNFVNNELMVLWEKGLVDIDLFADEPLVSLNEKSYDKNEISKLSKQEKWSLDEMKRILGSKEL